jgi:hypothetical protein
MPNYPPNFHTKKMMKTTKALISITDPRILSIELPQVT